MNLSGSIDGDHPLRAAVELLEKLPPPTRPPVIGDNWALENRAEDTQRALSTVRCACNKMVSVTEMRPFNTGIIDALDNVCHGCRSGVDGMCLLVCIRCKAVVARLGPHKSTSGFVYEAGKSYHVDCCVVCAPEIVIDGTPSLILEELMHYRKTHQILPQAWAQTWKERQQKNPLILT